MSLLLVLACVDMNTLQRDFAEAERMYREAAEQGARECTPRELAMAETNLEFSELEFEQGDPRRAREHVDVALANARVALETAPSCGPTDSDGDGIDDDVDLCPDEPEDLDGVADDDGCPDLELDADGDGLLDAQDACPSEPEDLDAYMDGDGCPDIDNDADGVLDAQDACPMQAEDLDRFEDSDGCPDIDNDRDGFLDAQDMCPDSPGPDAGCPLSDRDGDGFLDDVDRCPGEAGSGTVDGCPVLDFDKDGIADVDDQCPGAAGPSPSGCPDRDNDGVLDRDDRCPLDPETVNAYMDADGCPDVKPQRVTIKSRQIVIDDKVQFQTNKAVLLPVSYPVLDDVIQVMKDYPQITVRIEGHTDSEGSEATNLALSKARADAVFEYMVAHGIEGSRLVTEGLGETRPIDTNKTPQGRANNRRVEFHIVKGLEGE